MQDKFKLLKLILNWQIDIFLIYRYIDEGAKPIIVHLCHFFTCHVIMIFFKLTNLVPFCRKVMLCIPLYTACLLLVTHKSYSKLQVYCNSSRTSLIEILKQKRIGSKIHSFCQKQEVSDHVINWTSQVTWNLIESLLYNVRLCI